MPEYQDIYATVAKPIPLGKQGENEARRIIFDVSDWEATYGTGGWFSLLHQRQLDARPYPVTTTEEEGRLFWVVTAEDTAEAEKYGKVILRYYTGDREAPTLVKSQMYLSYVERNKGMLCECLRRSIDDCWLQAVSDFTYDAQQSATEAADSAQEAEGSASRAATSADQAHASAQAAESSADAAASSAADSAAGAAQARAFADSAQFSAETAAAKAEEAAGQVEEARSAAEGAAAEAAAAERSAVRAETAAESVIGEATTTKAGLMSAADKQKLNGIAAGAQANVLEAVTVNGTAAPISNKTAAITVLGGVTVNGTAAPVTNNKAVITVMDGVTVNGTALPVTGNKAALQIVAGQNVRVDQTGGTVTITSTASGGGEGGAVAVTVSGIQAASRIYNGANTAILITGGATLDGVLSGDDVGVTCEGVFVDASAGKNKAVLLYGMALTGTDAGTYRLSGSCQTFATADISARNLTVSSITANNKAYDGTTEATLDMTGMQVTGLVEGDTVHVHAQGRFDSAAAGTGKTVTIRLMLTGPDAGNYDLASDTLTATADITG